MHIFFMMIRDIDKLIDDYRKLRIQYNAHSRLISLGKNASLTFTDRKLYRSILRIVRTLHVMLSRMRYKINTRWFPIDNQMSTSRVSRHVMKNNIGCGNVVSTKRARGRERIANFSQPFASTFPMYTYGSVCACECLFCRQIITG